MAEPTTIQDPSEVESEIPQARASKPQSNEIIIGEPFSVGGRDDNVIRYITVDHGPKLTSGWKVRNDSVVEVSGKGLNRYNRIALWMGNGPVYIEQDAISKKSDGTGFEFTAGIPENLYKDGSQIRVEFLERDRPENDRMLSKNFYYSTEEKDEEKRRREKHEAEEKARLGKSRSEVVSEFINASIGGAPEALAAGFAGTTAKQSNKPAKASDKSAFPADGKKAENENSEADDAEAVQAEAATPINPKASPETFKQSADLVGEYIDKHSEIIANPSVRSEVLSALASGKLGGLSQDGKEALQRVVSSAISGQTGLDVGQLTAALKMVSNQIVQGVPQRAPEVEDQVKAGLESSTKVSAQDQGAFQAEQGVSQSATTAKTGEILSERASVLVTTTGKTSADISGKATSPGQSTTQVSGKIAEQIRASGAPQVSTKGSAENKISTQVLGSQPSEVSAKISAHEKLSGKVPMAQAPLGQTLEAKISGQTLQSGLSGQTTVQGAVAGTAAATKGGPDARQSLEMVREHLSKNPQLIFNIGVRGEILEALGNRNLGGLNAEARVALKQTLKSLGKSHFEKSPQLPGAAQNVNAQLDQPSQTSALSFAPNREAPRTEKVTSSKPETGKIAQLSESQLKQPKPQTANKDSISTPAQTPAVVATLELEENKKMSGLQGQQPENKPKTANKSKLPAFARPLKNFQGMVGRTMRKGLLGVSLALSGREGNREANIDAAQKPQAKIENIQPNTIRPEALSRPEAAEPQSVPADSTSKPQPGKLPGQGNAEKEAEESEAEQPEAEEPEFNLPQSPLVEAGEQNIDKAVKKVVTAGNQLLDAALMEGVSAVWLGAIPSFGISIIIGAVVGDFLWVMKNSLIMRILKPLLKTEALKNKAKEIAKQVKISAKIKANIASFNAIIAAAIFAVICVFLFFMMVGCNYPVPGWISRHVNYRTTYIGFFIGDSCKVFDIGNLPNSTGSVTDPATGITPRGP